MVCIYWGLKLEISLYSYFINVFIIFIIIYFVKKWRSLKEGTSYYHIGDFLIHKIVNAFWSLGLQKLFYSEKGVHLSTATIKRTRRKPCWKKWGPCYCQMVQESKHVTYLAFVQQSLQSHNKLVWCSVMGKSAFDSLIWAWISTRCAMLILILTGIRKKEFYINNILGIVLLYLLFMQAMYTDSGYQFQKDNDPKNTDIKFP